MRPYIGVESGTQLEPDDPIGLISPGGEHHDGDVRAPSELTGDVEAVAARQPEVQDDQVRLRPASARERGLAVPGHEDLEPRVFEVVTDQARDLHLVLHDQDRFHRVCHLPAKPDQTTRRKQAPPPGR